MTFYLSITPIQEPFDLAFENGKSVVAFNIATVKRPSGTFLEELVEILEDASVGTFNTNIFVSKAASIPAGEGPFLFIVETGGAPPQYDHNSDTPSRVRPSAQITVRADSYVAARTMARAAYDALAAIKNTEVTL